MDALIGNNPDLFNNLNQVKTLIDNIAKTPEEKTKRLTGALATISFDENDPEMLYSLGICSVANMYHENLKYENTKPEELNEAEKVFNDIFGEHIDLVIMKRYERSRKSDENHVLKWKMQIDIMQYIGELKDIVIDIKKYER